MFIGSVHGLSILKTAPNSTFLFPRRIAFPSNKKLACYNLYFLFNGKFKAQQEMQTKNNLKYCNQERKNCFFLQAEFESEPA